MCYSCTSGGAMNTFMMGPRRAPRLRLGPQLFHSASADSDDVKGLDGLNFKIGNHLYA